MVQDREHIFTSCSLVASAWLYIRSRLLRLFPSTVGAVGISNEDFLLLQFPKDTLDKECVWLIGNFCEIVSKTVVGKKIRLQPNQLAGRLRSRLMMMKKRAVVQPSLFDLKSRKIYFIFRIGLCVMFSFFPFYQMCPTRGP